ncbi:MAG: universal stress protein [Ancalomicrobiaceae bacterium]|nr:universal stress protein [Ancalomicrobiaceae bacterium]
MMISDQSMPRPGSLHAEVMAAAAAELRVLVFLPEPETAESCLGCAVAAAGGRPAQLSAVHIGFDPRYVPASAEEVGIQALREIAEGTADQRSVAVKAAFDRFVATAPLGLPITWKNNAGDIDRNIRAEALNADLIVIGQPVHLDASDALHSVIFHGRRPTLVAPRKLRPGPLTIGRHMVVGWKPTKSAHRAVMELLPWLQRADKVSVVCVRTPKREPYEPSARAFFTGLGIDAEIVSLEKDSRSVGDRLVAETKRLGADCLLISAFQHGQLLEFILGGVTRDVLTHADIPVFMMH